MEENMIVLARFKDATEDDWFEVLLDDNQRMYKKETGEEITRTDLLFKGDDDEIIDMEKEWEEYRREKLRDRLHAQASYLAWQTRMNQEGTPPKVQFNLADFFRKKEDDVTNA